MRRTKESRRSLIHFVDDVLPYETMKRTLLILTGIAILLFMVPRALPSPGTQVSPTELLTEATASIEINPTASETAITELPVITQTSDWPANTLVPVETPIVVASLPWGAAMVAVGSDYTCAVTHTGVIKCWGNNSVGQLGDGTTLGSVNPVEVQNLNGEVIDISTGSSRTCVLVFAYPENKVKCWGWGEAQQLDGEPANARMAVEVDDLNLEGDEADDIDSGSNHACALMWSGKVKCWGDNSTGQLGDGTTTASSSPVEVSGLGEAGIPVVAGGAHTCVLVNDGDVKCWGDNSAGQLGNGTTESSNTPVNVAGLGAAVFLAAGHSHTCALLTYGRVQCWGNNYYGQLGDGTTTNRSAPVEVSGLSGVQFIAAGALGQHTCAVLNTGQVKCWGQNSDGQLGDGTTINQPLPVEVIGLTASAISISANQSHTCVVLTSSGINCWGKNDFGQLGDGTDQQRLRPVEVIGPGGFPLTATPAWAGVTATPWAGDFSLTATAVP